jgi:hypothetical protein
MCANNVAVYQTSILFPNEHRYGLSFIVKYAQTIIAFHRFTVRRGSPSNTPNPRVPLFSFTPADATLFIQVLFV